MKKNNIQNDYGKTALHIAIEKNSYEIVKFIISNGSDFGSKDIQGNTVLHLAVQRPNQAIYKLIFANFCQLLNDKNKNGKTALHLAIESRNDNYVQHLVEKGADVNALMCNKNPIPVPGSVETFQLLLKKADKKTFKNNVKLLHLAARMGCVQSVKKIIKAGLNVNDVVENKEGEEDERRRYDRYLRPDVTEFQAFPVTESNLKLISNRNIVKETPLHIAVKLCHHNVVEELIKFKVNRRDSLKRTPLHYCRSKAIYELLVRGGADENKTDKNGNTVLHEATQDNFIEVVECFLNQNPTQVDCQNKEGETALHLAAWMGNAEVAEFLLSKGADINMKDNKGKTPIYYAVVEGQVEMFNSLRNRSAEINLNDYKGMIHETAGDERDKEDFLRLLLKIGVDVDEADEDGKTALHYAAQKDSLENFFTLIDAGANV